MRSARLLLFALAFALVSTTAIAGQAIPAASVNDNRASAGGLRNGQLILILEARPAVWYPEKDGGPHLTVSAFAEEGHAPQIPGPMIRVPEGTEISATIRNLLDHTIYIHALGPRAATLSTSRTQTDSAASGDANILEIAAGSVRE